jgi:hypothetical protein
LLEFHDRSNGIWHYPNAKAVLFRIQIGNLGEFLLQTVQNDVQEERPMKRFSWQQHDDIDNSENNLHSSSGSTDTHFNSLSKHADEIRANFPFQFIWFRCLIFAAAIPLMGRGRQMGDPKSSLDTTPLSQVSEYEDPVSALPQLFK